MKIFDCFMYFDEELILDVRLNTLNKFVDYFVIVESKFTHSGEERNLRFNHQKFEKFKDKIIYLIYDQQPAGVKSINNKDTEHEISSQYIFNAGHRENGQRNYIAKGLVNADENDIILISDVDEIPNLYNINFKNIDEKIILFKQNMFYYKFNLHLPKLIWTGTKGCKKKDLLDPQWLRNVKDRKYRFFRLDTLFSKNKYQSIKYINNGGWHFTNLKTAKEIEFKLKSYLHHREFDQASLSILEINELVEKKQALYDLGADKRNNKVGNGLILENFEMKKLPDYIINNLEKYKSWLD